MKDFRTIPQVLADIRRILAMLLDEAPGFVRAGNQTGAPPPPNGEPFATLLCTSATHSQTFATRTDTSETTVATCATSLATLHCDVQIFRRDAFAKADFLSRVLREDYGAQALRSIAVSFVDAQSVDLTSAVATTLWEERSLMRAVFTAFLTVEHATIGLDPAKAAITFTRDF